MTNLSQQKSISIRPFIGAKDFKLSRNFYNDIGFIETILNPSLSLFTWGDLGFYLQNAYVKDWIDNTMLFFEVKNLNNVWENLTAMKLTDKYPAVKIIPIRRENWGKECFLHDPSGILIHFGEFS